MIPVRNAWEVLDLARHGYVEASAGTGKTFTIERLVLRILTRPRENPWARPVGLDEILVVTYTEKAAGELRSRIRGILEAVLRGLDDPSRCCDDDTGRLVQSAVTGGLERPRRFLEDCLTRFDGAAIHTIHSFCNRYLNAHAFDSRVALESELGDAAVAAQRAVIDLVRSDLRAIEDLGAGALSERLELWGLNIGDLVNLLAQIVPSFSARRRDRLMPPADVSREQAESTLLERARFYRDSFCRAGDPHPFLRSFDRLKDELRFNVSSFKARRNRWTSLVTMPEPSSIGAIVRWLDSLPGTNLGQELLVKLNDGGELPLEHYAGRLGPIDGRSAIEALAVIDELRNLVSACRYGSLGELIAKAQDLVHARKMRTGLTTYDDMILDMHKALQPGDAPLLDTVRRQFRYGIIDEFQDTNRLQWDIFRRIFVDEADRDSRNRGFLYMVGDPKQSIFSFQGSNVEVYKKALTVIRGSSRSAEVILDRNFRSSPAMIKACNALFQSGEWFSEATSGVPHYREVICGNGKRVPCPPLPSSGAWPDAAIVLRPAHEEEAGDRPSQSRRLATWIVSWIQCLTGRINGISPMRIPHSRGEQRDLSLSDICILVEKHSEARQVIRALRRFGLPFTKQRNSGLFASPECLHLILVLSAVEEPGNNLAVKKALLTPFFGYEPAHLVAADSLFAGAGDQCLDMVRSWAHLGSRRDWPRLFGRLFEETGVLPRIALGPEGRLRIAALRQLKGYCLRQLIEERRSLSQLVSRLRSLNRNEIRETGEEDLFHRETESDAVRILTMHSSKGLEFPVVFIAAGAGKEQTGRAFFRTRNDDDGTDFWLDLDLCKGRYFRERSQEQRRLYYVALTRAMYRLFIPVWHDPSQVRPERDKENASASERFLSRACTEALTKLGDPRLIAVDHEDHRPSPAGGDNGSAAGTTASSPKTRGYVRRTAEFAEGDRQISSRVTVQRSYSGIARLALDQVLRTDKGSNEPDEPRLAPDYEHLLEREILRPGAITGDALHAILERADFAQWAQCESPARIMEDRALDSARELAANALAQRGILLGDGLDGDRTREAVRYVWNTLRAIIPDPADRLGAPIVLGRIPPGDRGAEAGFHFTFGKDGRPFPRDKALGGWVIGFIDLLFTWGGRYYLLDWKSNWIASGDYRREAIRENMLLHHYDLQYTIYGLALHRWLRERVREYRPAQHFGGVIYAYLRGTRADDATTGIWTQRPDGSEIGRVLDEEWPAVVTARLRESLPRAGGRA